MATKKDVANTLVSGGTGFLLGYLLRPRAKAQVAGGVELSNLAVDPIYVLPGEIVTISVDALNTGASAVTAGVVLHIGNRVEPQTVALEPGESRTLQWQYTAEDISGVSEERAVTVAIDPSIGSFSIVTPM